MGGDTGLCEGSDTSKDESGCGVSGYGLEELIGLLFLNDIGRVESVWEVVLFVGYEVSGGIHEINRCSGGVPDERRDIGDISGGTTQEFEVSGIIPIDPSLSGGGSLGLWDELLPYFRGGWVG